VTKEPYSHEKLTPTLVLTQGHDGWWLYDETQGMNLAMRAPSREAALLYALEYHQERNIRYANQHAALKQKVLAFASQLHPDEDD
jgi:endo-beta-N-acetylglucosaminidase D